MNVQNLKELTCFVLDLGEAISDSFDDGKITIMDAGNFISVFTKIGPALEGIADIPAEISDIDQAEIDEIVAYCGKEFDIADDELEARVEMGLAVGLKLAQLIGTFLK